MKILDMKDNKYQSFIKFIQLIYKGSRLVPSPL